MGLFGFLSAKPKNRVALDLSKVKVDMHSHLIPGIDDGAKNMDETIALLTKFEALGYSKIITTPHIKNPSYPNTSAIILSGLNEVRNEMKSLGIKLTLEAAAEYYYDESFLEKVKNRDVLTFGDNYVLFEFSFYHAPTFVDVLFDELINAGYKPVVAHFERYLYFLGSIEKAAEWRKRGVNIQINLLSLTGHYGMEIKKQAEMLVDAYEFDFIGSDCHRIEHLIILEENLTLPFFEKLNNYMTKNRLL
jgi:tyrosine-protein phosphatase YwqE